MSDPQQRPEVTPSALVQLMNGTTHYRDLTDEQLVEARAESREQQKRRDAEIAHELYTRHRSWRTVGALLGVNYTTARGWVLDAGLSVEPEESS